MAAPRATAAAPIAIPAMAPLERPALACGAAASDVVAAAPAEVCDAVGEEPAPLDADVVNGFPSSSDGHGSPGRSMNVESLASCFCVTRDVLALGLITPTIW